LTNLPLAICPQRSMRLLHCHTTQHVTVLKAQPGQRRRFWALRLPALGRPSSRPTCLWPYALSATCSLLHLPHDTACDGAEGTTRDSEGDFGPFDSCGLDSPPLAPDLPLAMPSARACSVFTCHTTRACDSAEGTTRDGEGDFGPFDSCAWTALLLTNLPLGHMPSAQHAACFTATRHSM